MLKEYAKRQDEVFLNNKEAVMASRYYFIVMIEAATNIANHICARLLNKVPSTYSETFLLLGESGLIKKELAINLAQMAKFRNLLVHSYGVIDDRRMLKIMREDLVDVENFLRSLGELIKL
ncbi:Uncharacterized conserved protein YutE, UPF0331/DUF86 family [Caldanaerovirga acetigignens]|uniref:Uncharacterized conserved protein YutE, UPF0331/DUF86 family n=1 Tax=Caldanaerovirga acetigignens TaxID=447595 RepID=A0A1M7M9J8_9FIRM|nr:DUF86 domain-containing protein [Caldanaerovirga acetigignens]SHM87458.1 Uncharacterized conserved protein YutE, UPF0331/DUF86 family [Caldanaerovirga acetigignens]